MIAWSAHEPHRVGEVGLLDAGGSARVLGRGGGAPGERVTFVRQRPGARETAPPLASPLISREQLRIAVEGERLVVERVGRRATLVDGRHVDRCTLAAGDTLLIEGQLLLLCTMRPRALPAMRDFPARALGDFGEPDEHGAVGESPAAFRLRDRIAWTAKAGEHTLLTGESGTGKELAARALHALSDRADKPFVARNAATLPPGLIDAELFGNIRGYPNPGMPERPGLIGVAASGTLFLDEIGELPAELQANLLRVLDAGGEYHRLGASRPQRADFRLIGATNRDPRSLKHDLAARLTLRVALPPLSERREDIPILVRYLLRRAAAKSPRVVGRFCAPARDGRSEPRTDPALVEHLLKRSYDTNVRELDALLWRCMSASRGDVVEWIDEPQPGSGSRAGEQPSRSRRSAAPSPSPAEGAEGREARRSPFPAPTPQEIRRRLEEHSGNVTRAARSLGLPSRYALYRLLKKHGDTGD